MLNNNQCMKKEGMCEGPRIGMLWQDKREWRRVGRENVNYASTDIALSFEEIVDSARVTVSS